MKIYRLEVFETRVYGTNILVEAESEAEALEAANNALRGGGKIFESEEDEMDYGEWFRTMLEDGKWDFYGVEEERKAENAYEVSIPDEKNRLSRRGWWNDIGINDQTPIFKASLLKAD